MSAELPQGWVTTTLGEVCSKPQYGWTCRGDKTGQIKYVRTTDISNGEINWESVPYCKEAPEDIDKYRVRPNDILVSRAGSVGVSLRIAEVPCDAVFASYLIRFNALDSIEPRYVEFFLKSEGYWHAISEFTAGIAVPNVNASKLASLELPLPPLAEQRRIVAKLETLLGKVDACQHRLENIPILLERFRRSVFAAACSGRLTADWRVQQGATADFEQTIVEAVVDYIGGYAYDSRTFLQTGKHQVIRIGNVGSLALKLDASPVYIPDEIANQTERFKLLPGDILISMTGTKYKQDYGHAALVRDSDGSLFLNQRVARLRCGERVVPKYVLCWLQTHRFREFFFHSETGNVNQGNVGADGIRKAPIELPALIEQQEIVRRVESLFSLADQIESQYARALAQVDRLTQSILGKAFRGELIPNEAELARSEWRDYEPAHILLERIKHERKAAESKRPNARRQYSSE